MDLNQFTSLLQKDLNVKDEFEPLFQVKNTYQCVDYKLDIVENEVFLNSQIKEELKNETDDLFNVSAITLPNVQPVQCDIYPLQITDGIEFASSKCNDPCKYVIADIRTTSIHKEHNYCYREKTPERDSTLSEGDARKHMSLKIEDNFDSVSHESTFEVQNMSHAGDKLYRCLSCEFETAFQSVLIKHNRIHLDEVFYCSDCVFITPYKTVLIRHKRVHHRNMLHHCSGCEFKTPHKTALIKHKRLHRGDISYHCSDCEFKTSYKIALIKHKRVHTSDILYHCCECGYKTARKVLFEMHKCIHDQINRSRHIAQKPLPSSPDNLIKHIRRSWIKNQFNAAIVRLQSHK